MISLKKENIKEMSDRQLSSNEIEKVLELQNSTLLRRLPGFGFPDFGLGHGLNVHSDDSDVTIFSNQKNVDSMLEQQKMLQNLLKQYQKNLVADSQWLNSKGLDLKCKKRYSTSDLDLDKRREMEKPVKENIPMDEIKSKLKLKKDEDGKVFSKQRKTNFTSKEVETLLDCVRKKREVILFGVAGGRGWAKAWQDIAKVVTKVEGIPRSEGDVRKKWTYLKWEAKNTSKPGRDPVSKQVLNILTSRDREVQEAMSLRNMDYQDDDGRKVDYRKIHQDVSARMINDRNYQKSPAQCKIKWKHMKASFQEAIRSHDRNRCPIYFDELYKIFESTLDEATKNVARSLLIRESPLGRGKNFKNVLEPKVAILKGEEENPPQVNRISSPWNRGGSAQRGADGNVVFLSPTSEYPAVSNLVFFPTKASKPNWHTPVESDVVVKEEPLTYDSDFYDDVSDGFGQSPRFLMPSVPPANPPQQQSQQQSTPQASPQSQPQPSPPPLVSQKKSGLPPLAPKPATKLPQSGSSSATIKQLPKLLPKPQSPPEVCLRWNSYHSNMQNTFPSLLNNEQFVDVTLACDGRSIKCHKVMLSACSPYMEELLSSNPCQHPIIFLKDMKFWQLQALIDFMYRGEVNVTQDKLPSLLSAAEALQIKGLASPVNHSAPPKITQVQPMPTTQHDISEEMDQVTYMRHLQLQTDIKNEYEDEYMQDTDESPPPTPKAKKKKLSHPMSQSQSQSSGSSNGTSSSTSSSNSNANKQQQQQQQPQQQPQQILVNKPKRDKERHSEPSTSQHNMNSAQANSNQHNASDQRRKSENDKLTDSESEFKSYSEDNRDSMIQEEDLDIDEEHAQLILERYSSQNDDYSRGGDGDGDDNSTTSG